jgi:capsular polysaccharide biosynthesis protein
MLRYWWVVVLTMAIALITASFFTMRQVPLYRSSASLVIGPSSKITNNREITEVYNTLDRRSVVATLAKLPSSGSVKDALARELPEAVEYEITSTVVPDTNILEISVTGPNPQTAQSVANMSAQQATVFASQLYDTFQLKVMDAATTARMVSPDPFRNFAAAILLGFATGLALAFFASLLTAPVPSHDVVKDPATVETASPESEGELLA